MEKIERLVSCRMEVGRFKVKTHRAEASHLSLGYKELLSAVTM